MSNCATSTERPIIFRRSARGPICYGRTRRSQPPILIDVAACATEAAALNGRNDRGGTGNENVQGSKQSSLATAASRLEIDQGCRRVGAGSFLKSCFMEAAMKRVVAGFLLL